MEMVCYLKKKVAVMEQENKSIKNSLNNSQSTIDFLALKMNNFQKSITSEINLLLKKEDDRARIKYQHMKEVEEKMETLERKTTRLEEQLEEERRNKIQMPRLHQEGEMEYPIHQFYKANLDHYYHYQYRLEGNIILHNHSHREQIQFLGRQFSEMNRTYIFKFKIGKMENKTGIKIGIAEKNAVEDRENSYKLENMITYLNSIHENEDGFKMTRGVIRNVSHSKRTQFFEEGDIIAVRLKRNLGAVTFILNEDFQNSEEVISKNLMKPHKSYVPFIQLKYKGDFVEMCD